MLVARTIFLTPGGGLWKMFCWSIMGMLECTGKSKQSQSRLAEVVLYHHLPLPEMGGRNGDTSYQWSQPAASCRPDPRKNLPQVIWEGLISVASTCGSVAAGALLTSCPRAPQEYPWQKSHSLPQSSSAAAPPQESPGAGERGILTATWVHSVRSGSQQGLVAVLCPSFALSQLSDAQESPAAAEDSRHLPPNNTCTY